MLAKEFNRHMNLRVISLVALLLTCLTTAALADLEIKKARYGSTSSYRDMRGVVTAYVRNNTLSFPINARSMGGDPTSRERDSFYIVYEVNGREYTETVPEGGIFTFQGLANVRPVRPLLNLPFLRPSTPVAAPLLIINRSGLSVRVYSVDRFGQWVWTANMIKGQSITLNGQLGQEWIAADHSNNILARERISRGDNTLWINEPGERVPVGGYRGGEAWVRFENAHFRPLFLYNLDSLGRWNWMATLEPGSGYSASTQVGETWIATDTTNHVVRQLTVGPGLSRVNLNVNN